MESTGAQSGGAPVHWSNTHKSKGSLKALEPPQQPLVGTSTGTLMKPVSGPNVDQGFPSATCSVRHSDIRGFIFSSRGSCEVGITVLPSERQRG